MAARGIISRVLPTFSKVVQTACTNQRYIVNKSLTQVQRVAQVTCRMYSSPSPAVPPIETRHQQVVVDYEYVTEATKNNNILLIDVRDHSEVQEFGVIPNSIHIPVAQVSNVLSTLSDKEFEETYKKPKPKKDAEVIFYCKIGRRSSMASDAAIDLGYTNIKNYVGSWTEWVARREQKA